MGFTTPIAKWTLDLSKFIENLFIANTLGSTLTIFHSVDIVNSKKIKL